MYEYMYEYVLIKDTVELFLLFYFIIIFFEEKTTLLPPHANLILKNAHNHRLQKIVNMDEQSTTMKIPIHQSRTTNRAKIVKNTLEKNIRVNVYCTVSVKPLS